jgi:DNA polymerase-3 subunit beta
LKNIHGRNNVLRFYSRLGINRTSIVVSLTESDGNDTSENEFHTTIERRILEIAFNIKFLQNSLEVIISRNVVIEANSYIATLATIRSADRAASPFGEQENYLSILIHIHMDWQEINWVMVLPFPIFPIGSIGFNRKNKACFHHHSGWR